MPLSCTVRVSGIYVYCLGADILDRQTIKEVKTTVKTELTQLKQQHLKSKLNSS